MPRKDIKNYWQVINHMKVWFIWYNTIGFLPSCSSVYTTICIKHMATYKMQRQKSRWKLYKNAACHLEQILEAKPHKTAATQSLASYLTNHSLNTNKTCRVLLKKQRWTHKWHFLMGSSTWTCQCWSTSKDLLKSPLCWHKMQSRRPSRTNGL